MEILMNVFKCLVAIAGSILALVIIVGVIKTPFMKKRQKKVEKELMQLFQEAIEELKQESKENREDKEVKKPRNTKKKEEN